MFVHLRLRTVGRVGHDCVFRCIRLKGYNEGKRLKEWKGQNIKVGSGKRCETGEATRRLYIYTSTTHTQQGFWLSSNDPNLNTRLSHENSSPPLSSIALRNR